MKKIKAYTDGSCLGNPGKGGWGAIIQFEYPDKDTGKRITNESIIEKILRGGEDHTTNNRMEMTGVIEALTWIEKHLIAESEGKKYEIEIFSDSRLIIDTLTKNWKKKMNTDLWAQMELAIENLTTEKVAISWNWVKGHSSNVLNQRVDKIAVGEAMKRAK